MLLGRGVGWALLVARTAIAQDRTVADELPLIHPVTGKVHVWRAAGDRLGTLLGTSA
jgi:hypothetical protein